MARPRSRVKVVVGVPKTLKKVNMAFAVASCDCGWSEEFWNSQDADEARKRHKLEAHP